MSLLLEFFVKPDTFAIRVRNAILLKLKKYRLMEENHFFHCMALARHLWSKDPYLIKEINVLTNYFYHTLRSHNDIDLALIRYLMLEHPHFNDRDLASHGAQLLFQEVNMLKLLFDSNLRVTTDDGATEIKINPPSFIRDSLPLRNEVDWITFQHLITDYTSLAEKYTRPKL